MTQETKIPDNDFRSFLIAGSASGVGKTSISIGIMALLKKAGYRVGAAKVGPDFIDPSYHQIATGRPSYNLDSFMTGRDGVSTSFYRACEDNDVVVVEGVMGLFDGSDKLGIDEKTIKGDPPRLGSHHSTYEISKILNLPIVLVLDGRGQSQSIGAQASGFIEHARKASGDSNIIGVIVNKTKSSRHQQLMDGAFSNLGIRCFGHIPYGSLPNLESRHLGLIPALERLEMVATQIDQIADRLSQSINIEEILEKSTSVARPSQLRLKDKALGAHLAAPRNLAPRSKPLPIAMTIGAAFSFMYQENIDLINEAGGQIVPFDPSREAFPKDAVGLIASGGFPQLYPREITNSAGLSLELQRRHLDGMPIWAECGGLMWLTQAIDEIPSIGLLDCKCAMTKKLTLGYKKATATVENLLFEAGSTIYGHEFHYSRIDVETQSLISDDSPISCFASPTLYASYLHLHLGRYPVAASRFIEAARSFQNKSTI
ncbi:cobyrinate a,c-diamide synthase [Acidithrix sp. C25]|uniref:cobyrinate a,c-diamide synthase n=1 Tax=Acidithrix sp. C25 TaxID=1671482 RepID=UPI00191B9A16|nr:cobyrinate a,c-diamide synthase [Acidithrix sp. C25]CAG4930227.1 unnamed protein product [Acidithrix sp. C25]